MSALFDTGFCFNTPSWHGQETLLAEAPKTLSLGRELAGLAWDPIPVPVYAYSGINAAGEATQVRAEPNADGEWVDTLPDVAGGFVVDPGHTRVVRSDNGELLDVTADTRSVISNTEWIEFGDALMEVTPAAFVDTMGSVQGGQIVYATVMLNEPYQIPGDPSMTFPLLSLQNRHSEGGGMRGGLTTVRQVCANTVAAAEAQMDAHGYAYTIRHTKNWRDKLAEAREVILGLRKGAETHRELMTELAGMPVDDEQVETFIHTFIPAPVDGVISKVVRKHIEADRLALRTILHGPTSVGIEGSAYWLFQGGVEFADHYRTARNPDTKLGRQLLRPEPMKMKAIKLARAAAAA